MEPGKGKSMMDGALAKVPPASHLEIVKTAHEHQIDKNEPAWVLVELAIGAVGGVEKIAKELRESSVKVTDATAAVVNESRGKAKDEITKMQEKAKGDIANALGPILKDEIGKAVDKLAMKTTAKKWLTIGIVAGVIVVTFGFGGAYLLGAQNGPIFGPMADWYTHLLTCDEPGFQTEMIGKKLWCIPGRAPDGKNYGWTIPAFPGVLPDDPSPQTNREPQ